MVKQSKTDTRAQEEGGASTGVPVQGPAPAHFGRIAAIYLIGLLLGGLYVGLVSPLRTVIQEDFLIDSTLGIYVINIYTLFYAATISISGNLADRYGRRPVYLACLALFTAGSICCGLSQTAGGFGLLLVGRVIQAAGAGGVIPAATAELGTSAPEGKRGMWLGIAAATSGISNVLGAATGSLIVDIVGAANWGWAFFAAVPVGVLLIAGAFAWLPKREQRASGKLDLVGSLLLVVCVGALLLGITNIDTANVAGSLASASFLVPVAVAIAAGVVLVLVERRTEAPVLHLEFFSGRRMPVLLAASFFIGCSIISMQMIPEFAEFALNQPAGSGGYYVTIVGVFAIAGPIIGGKLIDRFHAKPVLNLGLAISAVGFLFLGLAVAVAPSVPLLLVGLAIMGLGMGFSMGTPINYLTLHSVDPSVSNSAIATITLMRQVGTTLFPSVLVAFTTAGNGMAGYTNMFIAVAAVNVLAILVMVLFPKER